MVKKLTQSEAEEILRAGRPVNVPPVLTTDRVTSWSLVVYQGKIYTLVRSGTPSDPFVGAYEGCKVYNENIDRYGLPTRRFY